MRKHRLQSNAPSAIICSWPIDGRHLAATPALACADADDNPIRILMPRAARPEAKKAGQQHRLAGILCPLSPQSSPYTTKIQRLTSSKLLCCAARSLRTNALCGAAPAARNPQSDVEDGARGARLERRRRHQMRVARAFSTAGGAPLSPGNREDGSSHLTRRGDTLRYTKFTVNDANGVYHTLGLAT